MNKYKKQIVTLFIILIVIFCFVFIKPLNTFIKDSITVLSKMGIDGIINYIRNFGTYAAIISFILMILQSIIAPIPAFLITLANAAIFGWKFGALLSWSSAMVGAMLCFAISRILGRDFVLKLVGKGPLLSIDSFFERYGKHTILIARLLPFIPFDLVSYAAGLTGMSLLGFLVATGIGQLPATIVYSYVGGTLTGGAKMMMIGLLVLFALTIAIYVAKKVYEDKHKSIN